MERMEGRAKEKDKDGQSVNPRLAWDVCVLVNLTWDRFSVRRLSIISKHAENHLEFLSVPF